MPIQTFCAPIVALSPSEAAEPRASLRVKVVSDLIEDLFAGLLLIVPEVRIQIMVYPIADLVHGIAREVRPAQRQHA
jgi:hypothetical protein